MVYEEGHATDSKSNVKYAGDLCKESIKKKKNKTFRTTCYSTILNKKEKKNNRKVVIICRHIIIIMHKRIYKILFVYNGVMYGKKIRRNIEFE